MNLWHGRHDAAMAQTAPQKSGVVVQIFGEEYRIATPREFDEVQRIAAYVDQKMRQIAGEHAGRVPRATLAVLAAMEITGELFGAMSEQSQLTEAAQQNLERLSRLAALRRLIGPLTAAVRSCYESGSDPGELVERAREALAAVETPARAGSPVFVPIADELARPGALDRPERGQARCLPGWGSRREGHSCLKTPALDAV